MNPIFLKKQFSFLIQLTTLSLILFGIHTYLIHYFFDDYLFFPLWQIYLFHFIITFLVYTFLNYKYSNGKIEIFNSFMIATFLKMTLAIIFLLPLLLSEFENKKPDVFNFFIPYFLFLIFEVYSVNTFLQKKP